MKDRILTNWTFTRALYLALGTEVIVQSWIDQQWAGVAFGGYFASMGLFAFGCASGGCLGGNCASPQPKESTTDLGYVDFEEVKTK